MSALRTMTVTTDEPVSRNPPPTATIPSPTGLCTNSAKRPCEELVPQVAGGESADDPRRDARLGGGGPRLATELAIFGGHLGEVLEYGRHPTPCGSGCSKRRTCHPALLRKGGGERIRQPGQGSPRFGEPDQGPSSSSGTRAVAALRAALRLAPAASSMATAWR